MLLRAVASMQSQIDHPQVQLHGKVFGLLDELGHGDMNLVQAPLRVIHGTVGPPTLKALCITALLTQPCTLLRTC
jgi:hypothetical protein